MFILTLVFSAEVSRFPPKKENWNKNFEVRDQVKEAKWTIYHTMKRSCMCRMDVAKELTWNEKKKKNHEPTRLYAANGQTATETIWNELCRSMSTGYIRGSIEHILRLSSAPASKPSLTTATHWCTCNINHWSFLFHAILHHHLRYHFKDRDQSIKCRIKAIR